MRRRRLRSRTHRHARDGGCSPRRSCARRSLVRHRHRQRLHVRRRVRHPAERRGPHAAPVVAVLRASVLAAGATAATGIGRITMLAFTTEWVVGGGSPWIFHASNIALYGAITVAVFWIATLLLPLDRRMDRRRAVRRASGARRGGRERRRSIGALGRALPADRGRVSTCGRRLTGEPSRSVRRHRRSASATRGTLLQGARDRAAGTARRRRSCRSLATTRPLRARLVSMRPLVLWQTLVAVALSRRASRREAR